MNFMADYLWFAGISICIPSIHWWSGVASGRKFSVIIRAHNDRAARAMQAKHRDIQWVFPGTVKLSPLCRLTFGVARF